MFKKKIIIIILLEQQQQQEREHHLIWNSVWKLCEQKGGGVVVAF